MYLKIPNIILKIWETSQKQKQKKTAGGSFSIPPQKYAILFFHYLFIMISTLFIKLIKLNLLNLIK